MERHSKNSTCHINMSYWALYEFEYLNTILVQEDVSQCMSMLQFPTLTHCGVSVRLKYDTIKVTVSGRVTAHINPLCSGGTMRVHPSHFSSNNSTILKYKLLASFVRKWKNRTSRLQQLLHILITAVGSQLLSEC